MNIQSLKMKDLAEVERLSGFAMDEWESCPKVKLTCAIAYVIAKKTNTGLKFEDVEDMTLDEMTKLTEGTELPKANIS